MSPTARPIVVVGHPVLAEPSRPVHAFDDALSELVDDLFASMAVANGVGLAAPQVGIGLAVFVYDCADAVGTQHRGHVVNPTIELLGEMVEGEEGCLSVPGPYSDIKRSTGATVRGFDREGTPVEVVGTGYFARCLQHETDHLEGKLYIDKLPRNKRRRLLREMELFSWNAPN